MARSIKRGSEKYLSRNCATHSSTNAPQILTSTGRGSASGAPESASVSC